MYKDYFSKYDCTSKYVQINIFYLNVKQSWHEERVRARRD